MSFLSPDSKIMQALTRICDLVILNVLFLLTCLPVFTMGAASAALYDMCFRMLVDEEGGIVKGYFRAFRKNFRQATPVFLVLALFFAVTGFYVFYFGIRPEGLRIFEYVFFLMLLMGAMVYGYAFALVSQFQNTTLQTLLNALLLSIGYLPRTLIMTFMNVLPLALLMILPATFFKIAILWFVIYFAAIAYVNALVMKKVFAPLMNTQTS